MYEKLRPNEKWFTHAGIKQKDREARERFLERLSATTDLFEIIRSYINEQRRELDKGEESLEDFEDGAWPYKQAYRAGQRAAYSKIDQFLPDPKRYKDPE